MKCRNCGDREFAKFSNHYECMSCGEVYTEITHSHEIKKNQAPSYEALKNTVFEESVSSDKIRVLSLDILREYPNDAVANLMLAYTDRQAFPEKYKDAILSLQDATLGDETEVWLTEFLIRSAEYKYLNTISSMLIGKGKYKNYSKMISQMKKKLEGDEEKFSNIPRDVFVCYSSNDLEEVRNIVSNLENDGNTCWYADRNMPRNNSYASNYKDYIIDAISKCKVFLTVMSKDAMLSKDVQWELDVAERYNKAKRIEYRITNDQNTTRFKHFFDGIQWIDASKEPQYNALLERTCDMLKEPEIKQEIAKSQAHMPETVPNLSGARRVRSRTVIRKSPGKLQNLFDAPEKRTVNFIEELRTKTEMSMEEVALEHFEAERYNEGFELLKSSEIKEIESLTGYYVGYCFENGYGTEKNAIMAERFYKIAEKLEKGTKANLGRCAFLLGVKYASSDNELTAHKAFRLFEKAVSYGDVKAMYNLGICHKNGIGTVENPSFAVECFKKSMVALPSESGYQLGQCYENGIGVTRNLDLAMEYYEKSARVGNKSSNQKLIGYGKGGQISA